MQSPPLRTAKDFFPRMVDEAKLLYRRTKRKARQMWIITTKEQEEKQREAMAKEFMRHVEEAAKRREAREQHIKATTCPHCGRHDPIPPWLQY